MQRWGFCSFLGSLFAAFLHLIPFAFFFSFGLCLRRYASYDLCSPVGVLHFSCVSALVQSLRLSLRNAIVCRSGLFGLTRIGYLHAQRDSFRLLLMSSKACCRSFLSIDVLQFPIRWIRSDTGNPKRGKFVGPQFRAQLSFPSQDHGKDSPDLVKT